jgi:hypothetical protein
MRERRDHMALGGYCFATAPPEAEPNSVSRFRVPRGLPHKDAPAYQASIYFWWWEYLKRNECYQVTCDGGGSGPLSGLYRDFGNVFEGDFLSWWRAHRRIFAERSGLVQDLPDAAALRSKILYEIDPARPLSVIQEEVKAIHLRAHAIMPKSLREPKSTALYPVHANVASHALWRTLTIWDLRKQHATANAYELGLMAGLRPNLMPVEGLRAKRTRRAQEVREHNRRAEISIANQTHRFLRVAAQYVHHVGQGVFPRADTR